MEKVTDTQNEHTTKEVKLKQIVKMKKKSENEEEKR